MIEVQVAPVRSSVHIPVATLWAHFQGGDVDKGLAELEKQAQTMIDDLLWWTSALKAAANPANRIQEPKPMFDVKSQDTTATRIARRTRGQNRRYRMITTLFWAPTPCIQAPRRYVRPRRGSQRS